MAPLYLIFILIYDEYMADASCGLQERFDNKTLFRLIWPLILEQILTVTMGAVDTIMVSSVGEFAISGVNIINNISNLLIIAFTALTTGGAVVVSQYIGRRDSQNVNIASRQLYYIVCAASLVIMIIVICFGQHIVVLIYGNIEFDVLKASSDYFFITAFSFPLLASYSACAALFRAAGNSRITLRISIIVNLINIAGNYFFIYHLGLGVIGAALSTLISRFVASLTLTSILINNKVGPLNLKGLTKISFNRANIRSILNVGLPSGIEFSMFQFGRLLTQRLFAPFGTAALAANAVASVVNSFSFMPGMAFGIALITVVGQCVGAGDYSEAKRYTVKIMKIAWITLFIISVLIMIFLDSLVSLFNLGPEAFEMAKVFLRVHCISMAIGWVFSFTLPSALKAAGDAKFVMIAGSISMWAVRVSAAYFLVYVIGIGPIGVWLAMGGDFLVRGICFTLRWFSEKWQGKKVIYE